MKVLFLIDIIYFIEASDVETTVMSQNLVNISGISFGTLALLPQNTQHSQVSRNILTKDGEGKIFGLYRGHEQTFFSSYLLHTWNSLCMTVNLSDSKPLKIYLNGNLQETTSEIGIVNIANENIKLMMNSTLWKSFQGSVTDLNVWTRLLSNHEILRFTNCTLNKDDESKVIQWNYTNFSYSGVTEIIKNLRGDICPHQGKYMLVVCLYYVIWL